MCSEVSVKIFLIFLCCKLGNISFVFLESFCSGTSDGRKLKAKWADPGLSGKLPFVCRVDPVLSGSMDLYKDMPSVLWHCWLGVRKSIQPVKIEWWGVGLERVAGCLHIMAQLMPLHPKTPSSLASFKYRLVYLSTQVVLVKMPLNTCSSSMSNTDGIFETREVSVFTYSSVNDIYTKHTHAVTEPMLYCITLPIYAILHHSQGVEQLPQ